jgi:hypothetical protein
MADVGVSSRGTTLPSHPTGPDRLPDSAQSAAGELPVRSWVMAGAEGLCYSAGGLRSVNTAQLSKRDFSP